MQAAPEFDEGPSSLSTLHFTPDFITNLLDDDVVLDSHRNEHSDHDDNVERQTSITLNDSYDCAQPEWCNHYHCTSTTRSTPANEPSSSAAWKNTAVSDYETLAFVGLRDIVHIDADCLAKLYKYTKQQYQTFQAAIYNKSTDYEALIHKEEFKALYHFFGRIEGKESWLEICHQMGFTLYFRPAHLEELFAMIQNTEIRAKNDEFPLRFFMQFIMLYWRQKSKMTGDICNRRSQYSDIANLCYFFVQSLHKAVQFITRLTVNQDLMIYCLLSKTWINAVITKISKPEKQIYVQYTDGVSQHQWLSAFSPRLAPMDFRYHYVPNMRNRNNVPCIIAFVDEHLDSFAVHHLPVRRTQTAPESPVQHQRDDCIPKNCTDSSVSSSVKTRPNPTTAVAVPPPKKLRTLPNADTTLPIPKDGWYYELASNNVGPVSIAMLFLACVESQIDDKTPIWHEMFGVTSLSQLPHIVRAFRCHVEKCRKYIERDQNTTD
mmetsp:Transcript_42028/g.67563  ORF Transcript_42028/g.67563 Transcript_42028/m.67563 type:complete len:490 (-) Transcript_42028:192-1661(-)